MSSSTRAVPIHVISLGCPKNRVDSEVMLGELVTRGSFVPVEEPSEAEVILVNTCAFLGQAVEESIDTVLEAARYKTEGACKRLVVAGCLVQAHGEDLAAELPEVDAFLGLGEIQEVLGVARGERGGLLCSGRVLLYDHLSPRVLSLPGPAAYIKVAEGCNRRCSFCRIPSIRGPQQSRSPESVVLEAAGLASQGVQELNLVAQDLTAYGQEPGGPQSSLPELLRRLEEVRKIRWIRLLYLYPQGLDEELLDLLATPGSRLLPYVDLPLQHISDPILRAMRRGHDGTLIRGLVEQLRSSVPDLSLRMTLIVGFPGESEEQFEELIDFVEEAAPEHLALFRFSPEPGTLAAELPGQVPAELAAERFERMSELGMELSWRSNQGLVGQTVDALVEGPCEQSELLWQARTPGQGPEDIDGVTYIPASSVPLMSIVELEITEAHPYDLVGEPVHIR